MKNRCITLCGLIVFINNLLIFVNTINAKSVSLNNIGNEFNNNNNSTGSSQKKFLLERADLKINFNSDFSLKLQNNINSGKILEKKEILKDNKSAKKTEKKLSEIYVKKNDQGNGINIKKINDKNQLLKLDKFSSSEKIICTNINCIYPNNCNDKKDTCFCSYENAEVLNNINISLNSLSNLKSQGKKNVDSNYIHCSYRRKSKKIYLVLELFFNIGIGHFYAGKYQMAKIKLIGLCLPWIIYAIFILKRKVNLDDKKISLNELPILFYLIWIFWWFYDSLNIYLGTFSDENDVLMI